MNELEAVITLAQGFTKEDQRKIIEELEKRAKLDEGPLVRSWEEAYKEPSYYVDDDTVCEFNGPVPASSTKECFHTQKQAESYLAFAQLSHIVADANGEWEADWDDHNQVKYVIARNPHDLRIEFVRVSYDELPMRSYEIAEACLEMHRGLWKKFRML